MTVPDDEASCLNIRESKQQQQPSLISLTGTKFSLMQLMDFLFFLMDYSSSQMPRNSLLLLMVASTLCH
jgi:hypothetical protein